MNKKDALLKAAGSIVTEQGVQDLTLDGVAKRAEVSKGGLLYHFPTKEALIYGMIEHFIGQFDDLVAMEIEISGGKAGRWLRAYVMVCTEPYEEVNPLSRVLIAISASSPQFADPVLQAYERWRGRAESDGVPLEVARLVCMAADGCWLYSLHSVSSDKGAKTYLSAMRKQLLSLVDESVKATI
jgi:AcrR family transcriptional regulator